MACLTLAALLVAVPAWATMEIDVASLPAPVPVPEPSAKALRYYRTGNILWVVNQFWSLAVPAVILVTGTSARLRDVAHRVGRNRLVFTAAAFVVLYLVLTDIINLPLSVYQGYLRPHEYGLSNQSPGRWLDHHLKSLAVSAAISVVVVGVLYPLIRRNPRWWWLHAGLLTIPLMLFGAFVWPMFVDPLFNRFGPMRDHVLEARILSLARRVGVEGARVFEVDKSHDTNAVNAYVTGLFGSKRIVLWDTLLARLDADQVEFVMAHELGHYALGHVVRGVTVSSLLVLIGLYMTRRLAGWTARLWPARLGFDQLADVASIPLLLVCGQVVALALIPVGYAYSRHIEHEADRFALELTRANHAGASCFVAIQRENLSYPRPGPMYRIWRSTHPSPAERITFCNQYHPWREGRPLRYGGCFH